MQVFMWLLQTSVCCNSGGLWEHRLHKGQSGSFKGDLSNVRALLKLAPTEMNEPEYAAVSLERALTSVWVSPNFKYDCAKKIKLSVDMCCCK